MKRTLDFGNFFIIALTLVLFVVALFAKGITKDLLLEAGILLVSIKLIMFNYKQSLFDREVISRLDVIQNDISELKK